MFDKSARQGVIGRGHNDQSTHSGHQVKMGPIDIHAAVKSNETHHSGSGHQNRKKSVKDMMTKSS